MAGPAGVLTAVEPELGTRTWQRLRLWLPLGVIVAGFLVLTIAYNVRVPIYEAPDEPGHVRYVDALQRTGKAPSLSVSAEAWQPPLYYALDAALLKLLLRAEPAVGPVPNPNYSPSDLRRYVHPEDDGFPYRGPVLSIHLVRGFTSLFGAGTIVFVYLTSLLLFPERKLLALTAAASTALLPQFAFISAVVNNEVPAAFFGAGSVYFGLRFLRDGWWPALLLSSVALSLGVLTKSTVLVVAVVPALSLLLRPMPWSGRFRGIALLAGLLFTVTTRFYTRDILAWDTFFPRNPLPEASTSPLPIWDPAYRTIFLDSLLHSYWYVGGWMDVQLSPILYNLLGLIGAMSLAGMISFALSAQLSPFQKRGLLLLTLLSLGALCAILYYSMTQDFQPQGRYLFVAQPALALFLALGLASVVRRDMIHDHPFMLALPIVLLGVNVGIFMTTLPGAY